jgi:hypothetical protein
LEFERAWWFLVEMKNKDWVLSEDSIVSLSLFQDIRERSQGTHKKKMKKIRRKLAVWSN